MNTGIEKGEEGFLEKNNYIYEEFQPRIVKWGL